MPGRAAGLLILPSDKALLSLLADASTEPSPFSTSALCVSEELPALMSAEGSSTTTGGPGSSSGATQPNACKIAQQRLVRLRVGAGLAADVWGGTGVPSMENSISKTIKKG